MPTTGYIQVRAFTSDAELPLEDVAIAIKSSDGKSLAARMTNKSGLLDTPVPIRVPDRAASQSPGTGVVPFTAISIYARLENYEQIEAENVQVFADTVTLQQLKMIPLSELPDNWTQAEIFDTPAQNL